MTNGSEFPSELPVSFHDENDISLTEKANAYYAAVPGIRADLVTTLEDVLPDPTEEEFRSACETLAQMMPLPQDSIRTESLDSNIQGLIHYLSLGYDKLQTRHQTVGGHEIPIFKKIEPAEAAEIVESVTHFPAAPLSNGRGGQKIAVALSNVSETHELYRVYQEPRAEFIARLLGRNETAACRFIGNDKAVVDMQEISGHPIDKVEKVSIYKDVLSKVARSGRHALLSQLETAKASNPLVQLELTEYKDHNLGLAVREDTNGTKKVFVVGIDLGVFWEWLDQRIEGQENKQQALKEVQAQLRTLDQTGIPYEEINEFL